jgi:hypothetical protein
MLTCMARRGAPSDKQVAFTWTEPRAVLDAARGEVVYEAPEASRIAAGRAPRLPRVKQRSGAEPPSFGLPFGIRVVDGEVTCWSCARELVDEEVVRAGPGYATCPGCGARLPFAE